MLDDLPDSATVCHFLTMPAVRRVRRLAASPGGHFLSIGLSAVSGYVIRPSRPSVPQPQARQCSDEYVAELYNTEAALSSILFRPQWRPRGAVKSPYDGRNFFRDWAFN